MKPVSAVTSEVACSALSVHPGPLVKSSSTPFIVWNDLLVVNLLSMSAQFALTQFPDSHAGRGTIPIKHKRSTNNLISRDPECVNEGPTARWVPGTRM